MRTFNVRFAAFLAASFLVFGIILVIVHRVQVGRNVKMFLREADAAKEEGDLSEQIKNLSMYTQLCPDDDDQLANLGLLLVERWEDQWAKGTNDIHTFSLARNVLERVVRRDPSQSEARLKLVELMMKMGRLSDAKDHLQKFLLVDNPDNDEYLMLLVQCHIGTQDYDEAIETLKKVIRYKPDRIDAYKLLARVYRHKKELPEEADKCMLSMVERNPDFHEAHIELASYCRDIGTLDRGIGNNSFEEREERLALAAKHAEKALLLETDDRQALRIAARIDDAIITRNIMYRGRSEEARVKAARDTAARAIESLWQSPRLSTLLDGIHLRTRQERTTNRDSALGVLLIQKNKVAEAIKSGGKPTQEQLDTIALAAVLLIDIAETGETTGEGSEEAKTRSADETEAEQTEAEKSGEDKGREPIAVEPGTTQESALAENEQLVQAREIIDALNEAGYKSPLMDYLHAQIDYIKGNWFEALAGFHKASGGLAKNWPVLLPEIYYQTGVCCKNLEDTIKDDDLKASDLKEKLAKADLLGYLTGISKTSKLRISDIKEELLNADGDIPMEPNIAGELNIQTEITEAKFGAYHVATVLGMEYAYNNAREYISRAINLYPDSPELSAVLTGIELNAGNRKAAMTAMRQGRDKVVDSLKNKGTEVTAQQLQLIWYSAVMLIENGELDEAQTIVDVLGDTNWHQPLVDHLAARIEYSKGNWAEALKQFNAARPGLIGFARELAQADYLMGMCHARLGDNDSAIKAFQSAINRSPFMREARVGLALALVEVNRNADAVVECQKIISMGANKASILFAVSRILLDHNRKSNATPEQWEQLDKTLERAMIMAPGHPRIVACRVNSLLAQKRFAEAAKIADAARQKNPGNTQFWFMLISIARFEKDWPRVEKLLATAEKALGDCSMVRMARAECLRDRYLQDPENQKELISQIVNLSKDVDKFPPRDIKALEYQLLTVASQTRNVAAVEEIANMVAARFPKDARVRFQLLEIAFRPDDNKTMDTTKIDAALEELHKVDGKGARWLYGQAKKIGLLAKDGQEDKLDEAISLAKEAEKLEPKWSRVKTLLAEMYDRQKKYDLALKYYVDALKLGESNPAVIRHACHLLLASGRYEEAHQLISRLSVVPPELLGVASAGAARKGDFDQSLRLAREGVAANPDNYRNHMWLGQSLLIALGRNTASATPEKLAEMADEAEKAFRKATQLAPDVPGTWVVAIRSLASMKKSEEAYQMLDQAKKCIPADKADVALGQCYETLEMFKRAEERYEIALEANPDDVAMVRYMADFYSRQNKPTKAETQLTRITGGKMKASKADLIWARRKLAEILSAQPDLQKIQRAMKLLKKNLAEEPSAVDEAFLARLQVRMPAGADRKQAITTLEKLVKNEKTSSAGDRHALAWLYRQQGNWLKYSEHMRQLIIDHSDQPRFLIEFIDALLAHGDTVEAQEYLRQLEELAPNNARTYATKAQILAFTDKYDDAISAIGKYIDDNKTTPDNATERLAQAAVVLEQLGIQAVIASRQKDIDKEVAQKKLTGARKLLKAAESLLLRYVQSRRDQRIILANFYLRRGRTANALAIIENEWKVAEPVALAQVAKYLLESPNSTPDQVSRTERVVQAALEHRNRAFPLLRVLAEVRANHGKYDEAEAYYREILGKNPGDGAVMNNLALLMALQGKNLDESLELMNKAIELLGPLGPILDSRASVYLALKRPKEALADLDRAIKLKDTPLRRFHQAQAYHKLGKKKDASNSIKAAEKLGLKLDIVPDLEKKAYRDLKKALR